MLLGATWLAAVSLGGCSKFGRPAYDTIYVGQPQSQVRKKLGRPDRTVSGAWIYVRRRPFGSAAILLDKGTVSGKIWSSYKPVDREMIEQYRRKLSRKQ